MIARVIFINMIINMFCITLGNAQEKYHGPGGMDHNETTTCDEFSKYARFNPYSVLNTPWFVFYYWGPPLDILLFKFYVPGEKETAYLKRLVDSSVRKPVNWTAKYVLMKEKSNATCLLVERNDRGEYDLYELYDYKKGAYLDPIDVRIKQTGDNKYIGFMMCKTEIVYVMARMRHVPYKDNIQDAAALIGYRGRGGKSYLYQGHQWMPIPEADKRLIWRRPRLKGWEDA